MNKEETLEIKGFKRTNIFFVLFMSFMTFGIYICYWFLSRKNSFKKLGGENRIPYKWWTFFLLFTMVSFLYSLIGNAMFSKYGIDVLNSYEVIISFYFVGCLYFSIFRARDVIEDHVGERIFSPVLLVIFHIGYLQYQLNKQGAVKRA